MKPDGKYLYDGKEYAGLEDLPPEARALYEKCNSDGLLDLYSDHPVKTNSESNEKAPAKFEINGKKYNSLDELPLDVKEKILDKLALLERQGLRLILDENYFKGGKANTRAGKDLVHKFTEAPVAEVSSAFRYKLILGLVILAAAVFFIYIFISSYFKNQ